MPNLTTPYQAKPVHALPHPVVQLHWKEQHAVQSAAFAALALPCLAEPYQALPRPLFTETETEEIASRVYDYVWQRSASGHDLLAA